MKDDLLRAALDYAARGWRVHPLHDVVAGFCSCGKQDCRDGHKGGKHPRLKAWQERATTAPEQIRRWWTEYPAANIGIVTGAASDLFVLDVDGPEGAAALDALERAHGRLPVTVTAKTGRGGRHFYFRHPGGRVPKSTSELGRRLDVPGDGGQVVAPPSVSEHGPYTWLIGPDKVPLADAPEWLVALARGNDPPSQAKRSQDATSAPDSTGPRAISSTSGTPALDALHGVPEGRRNGTLFLAGCSDRGRGADDDAIRRGLFAAAARCSPPLPSSEVPGIVASVTGFPPGVPLSVHDVRDAILARLPALEVTLFHVLHGPREYHKPRTVQTDKGRLVIPAGSTWTTTESLAQDLADRGLRASTRTVATARDRLKAAGLIDWNQGIGRGCIYTFPHPIDCKPQITRKSNAGEGARCATGPTAANLDWSCPSDTGSTRPRVANLKSGHSGNGSGAFHDGDPGSFAKTPVPVLGASCSPVPDPQGLVKLRTPPNRTASSVGATTPPDAGTRSQSTAAEASTLDARNGPTDAT